MRPIRSAPIVLTVALIGLTIAGFWPSYLSRPFAKVDGYTHIHAAFGAIWLVLLLGQILLIRLGVRSAHRTVGKLSYLAAPLFVTSGLLLANFRFSRMDDATFAKEAYTLYLPISASVLFMCAYGLALVYRRRLKLHASFMLCTALVLVDPVVARALAFHVLQLPEFWHYQVITFAIEFAILLTMLRVLAANSPERSTFASFAVVFVAIQLLWFVVPRTSTWLAFAEWFRRLPLT